MFSIVDFELLSGEENLDISAKISDQDYALELDCKLPANRHISFDLLSNRKKEVSNGKLGHPENKVRLPLRDYNADSFTLSIIDGDGRMLAVCRIMRAFC